MSLLIPFTNEKAEDKNIKPVSHITGLNISFFFLFLPLKHSFLVIVGTDSIT